MLKNPLWININNEGLAVSFIWNNWSVQSLGYILVNTSLSLCIIWNNLLKDFQYLPLVKSCHSLLTMGAIAVSNPRPQLLTDAMHFAWIGLFQFHILAPLFYLLVFTMSRYSEYLPQVPTWNTYSE